MSVLILDHRIKPEPHPVISSFSDPRWEWFWRDNNATFIWHPNVVMSSQRSVFENSVDWKTLVRGRAMDFRGTSSSKRLTAGTIDPIQQGRCTLIVFLRFVSFSHLTHTIISKRDSFATDNSKWMFYFQSSSTRIVWNAPAGDVRIWNSTAPDENVDTMLAVTDNGTNSELFRNGISQGTRDPLTMGTDNAAVLAVGNHATGTENMNGYIYYVACINRAITAGEHLMIAQDPFGPFRVVEDDIGFVVAAAEYLPLDRAHRPQHQSLMAH